MTAWGVILLTSVLHYASLRDMMKLERALLFALVVLAPVPAHAQVIRLGSASRRTIEATTTEKISVPADAAIVKIGFSYTADTKDSAYTENVKVGNKIVKPSLTPASLQTKYNPSL